MFRKITLQDEEIYFTLANEFYHSDGVLHAVEKRVITDTFDEIVRSDEYLEGYIIELDKKDVGYALLAKTFSPEVGGKCIWIEEIYIRDGYRGKGIGTKFFDFMYKKYNDATFRYRLEAVEENQNAIRLYEKQGFKKLNYIQMVKDK